VRYACTRVAQKSGSKEDTKGDYHRNGSLVRKGALWRGLLRAKCDSLRKRLRDTFRQETGDTRGIFDERLFKNLLKNQTDKVKDKL